MKKSFSRILLAILFTLPAMSACQQKTIQAPADESKVAPRLVLFLTLKATKTDKGVQAELVEQKITEAYDTPRPIESTQSESIFRCEILDAVGFTLSTSFSEIDFSKKTKEDTHYVFLKFFEALPERYQTCVVSMKVSDGVWEELFVSELK